MRSTGVKHDPQRVLVPVARDYYTEDTADMLYRHGISTLYTFARLWMDPQHTAVIKNNDCRPRTFRAKASDPTRAIIADRGNKPSYWLPLTHLHEDTSNAVRHLRLLQSNDTYLSAPTASLLKSIHHDSSRLHECWWFTRSKVRCPMMP